MKGLRVRWKKKENEKYRLTWEQARRKGRRFFENLSDVDFLKIEIIEICPVCEKEYVIKPCTIMPHDHGHGQCCVEIGNGWFSNCDGCPFNG